MDRIKTEDGYKWIKNERRYRNHDLPSEIDFDDRSWESDNMRNRYLNLPLTIDYYGGKWWYDRGTKIWFGIYDENGKAFSYPTSCEIPVMESHILRNKILEKYRIE